MPRGRAHSYDDDDDLRQQSQRDRMAGRSRDQSKKVRDIGEIPPVKNPERRAAAGKSLRLFCEYYFAQRFYLGWSPDHLKVIAELEAAVREGGLCAYAMPRKSGKTTLSEVAVLWAMLYGYHEFALLVGAIGAAATEMFDSIKTALETNEVLAEDFPEVCHPIACLEGIAQRRLLYKGEQIHIRMKAGRIELPNIPGSPSSNACLRVASITARIRGMKYVRQDGRPVRPSLVIVDDPQTDKSAGNPVQCKKLENILTGVILGLAGPGKRIAVLMPCTVIRKGDLADRFLDREKHPDWNGQLTKLIYKFPTDEELWKQYVKVRADGMREGDRGKAGNDFYAAHRAAMDEGAVVAWPEKFEDGELSAVQHAMHLKIRDPFVFFAEYQNEPQDGDEIEGQLTVVEIQNKLSLFERGTFPTECTRLTGFIDVHKDILFWIACAWCDDFTGYIIDYGTFPKQPIDYFEQRNPPIKLCDIFENAGEEGCVHAGLTTLTKEILGKEWTREDGAGMTIRRCPVDANWGPASDVVYSFCSTSPHKSILIPSHGEGVTCSNTPYDQRKIKAGEQVGEGWRIPPLSAGTRSIRHVTYDVNLWKTFVRKRFRVARGDRGCLSIYGKDPNRHVLFAEHCTAEYSVETQGRGRTVNEFKKRPGRSDNHWWDDLVGAAMAASIEGCAVPGTPGKRPAAQRYSISELKRQAKARRT
jgi:hypothetical protein